MGGREEEEAARRRTRIHFKLFDLGFWRIYTQGGHITNIEFLFF
jgi:hypothetical protein